MTAWLDAALFRQMSQWELVGNLLCGQCSYLEPFFKNLQTASPNMPIGDRDAQTVSH
jgi:hypothetical protein